ncbi:MAG: hypothetical protein FJ381_13240 [Verrucomicrobia bacterium]|nr:hypothetical protein [Verrucomicrobiota bacterium]
MGIAGLCGVDGECLCSEQVPYDWIGLENQIRAARIHNIDALVRAAEGSDSDDIKPFEMEAAVIIVPHVADAGEARKIVDWVRFHPEGHRAVDDANIDGQFCLVPALDYPARSSRKRMLILQIESPEALEHREVICVVPGFSGILIGSGDFSHRIGDVAELDHPLVVVACRRMQDLGQVLHAGGYLRPVWRDGRRGIPSLQRRRRCGRDLQLHQATHRRAAGPNRHPARRRKARDPLSLCLNPLPFLSLCKARLSSSSVAPDCSARR